MKLTLRGEEEDARIYDFVARLQRLDKAGRARLRRNAGLRISESHGVLDVFYRLVPLELPLEDHETYFLVATLFPLAATGSSGDMGSVLKAAAKSRSQDRRFEALLDSDMEELPFRLRQAVSLARSSRKSVDWVRLLTHVLHWNDEAHWVQKQWARSYFGLSTRTSKKKQLAASDSETGEDSC
jgi:CRISPR system Cascade subunit CasB